MTFTFIAIGLVALTVVIHATGTTLWLRGLTRIFGATSQTGLGRTLKVVTSTVVLLLILHTIEIMVWAMAYLFMLPPDVLGTFEEATYFSFVTFSTLGYGDITLADENWRIMSGIEALNGILLVGWSTALLFAVVQRTWDAERQADEPA